MDLFNKAHNIKPLKRHIYELNIILFSQMFNYANVA